MRLWHQSLIPYLPRQQLLGQHRELCALRGKGWGRKHSTVDYVFTYKPDRLIAYHHLVMDEMKKRGYRPDDIWTNATYRGKELGQNWNKDNGWDIAEWLYYYSLENPIYSEHNDKYLKECLENLKNKGIEINV